MARGGLLCPAVPPQVNKIFIRFLAFPPQMGYVTGFCRLMLRISPISAI